MLSLWVSEYCFVANYAAPIGEKTVIVLIFCRGKLTSFERSTDFSGIQDVSIRRSSSVVIQNLGKRDIK